MGADGAKTLESSSIQAMHGMGDPEVTRRWSPIANLELLSMQRGDVFVSDKWRASLSALKEIRRGLGLTEAQLKHEVVNHSDGEIVNKNGYTTNPIEAKWSLIKRCVRSRYGGKLPSHNDRETWHKLINEHQAQLFLSIDSTFDFDN